MHPTKRQAVHWLFDAAVIVKGFDGVIEIALGAFILLHPGWIGAAAGSWSAELLERHPYSWLGEAVARWSDGLSDSTEHFASLYLVAHGVAKVFIAWGLWREKMWAFPTALLVFGLLILYQMVRFTHTHSLTLAVLIVLDLAVCYLIWREYGFRREALRAAPPLP